MSRQEEKHKHKGFSPIIKWSGSKRSQAYKIVKYFPNFERYFEPFVGGGSILYAVDAKQSICGDICVPLIELWNTIKNNPKSLLEYYSRTWHRLQDDGYMVYYEIRDRFNKYHNPLDLFFLSRTCVNGLIRFNKNGCFNNSLHHTRKGINPINLENILYNWSNKIQNTDFYSGDYRQTVQDISSNDFIYLDPPYFNTKGRYFGSISYDEFLEFLELLNRKNIKFALSYDGKRAQKNYTVDIPKELYKRHLFLYSGNSTFNKVINKKNESVEESLYLNY